MARTTTTAKLAKKRQPSPLPDWQSPRKPQPTDAITPAKLSLLQEAQALVGLNATPELLAAIIIAQAADRLGGKLIEAAAVSSYHRGS